MEISTIFISLKTACVSIIITFFLGVITAKEVVSIKNERIKIGIDGLFTLPLVLPPTVMGFFLLYLFGIKRPIGKFLIDYLGVKIAFSWSATVVAAVVISFPLMYRAARGAFEGVDYDFIAAGRTLGMSETKIFLKIVLPNSLHGLVSGGILAFARGLGEFGATTMIAGNIAGKTRTLPLAVYSAVIIGDMKTANQYVLIIVCISFIMIAMMNYVTYREKRKRSGRKG